MITMESQQHYDVPPQRHLSSKHHYEVVSSQRHYDAVPIQHQYDVPSHLRMESKKHMSSKRNVSSHHSVSSQSSVSSGQSVSSQGSESSHKSVISQRSVGSVISQHHVQPQRYVSSQRKTASRRHKRYKSSQRYLQEKFTKPLEKIGPIMAYPDALLGPVLILCGRWRGLDLEGWLENKVDVDLANHFGSPVVTCSEGRYGVAKYRTKKNLKK